MYGQPRGSDPTAHLGLGQEGAAATVSLPVGSCPGDRPHLPPPRLSGAPRSRSGPPAPGGSGPHSSRPWESGLRSLEASGGASCAAGSPAHSAPGLHDLPHLGPASRAGSRGARVSAAPRGGQGARNSLQGGGRVSGNRVRAHFGRVPTLHGGGLDSQLGSLSVTQLCTGPLSYSPVHLSIRPPADPHPSGRRPSERLRSARLGARSCGVSPALLATGHVTLDGSGPPRTRALVCRRRRCDVPGMCRGRGVGLREK